jgi:hypothetical protein
MKTPALSRGTDQQSLEQAKLSLCWPGFVAFV